MLTKTKVPNSLDEKPAYDHRNDVPGGDYYGVGIRARVGRQRFSYFDNQIPIKNEKQGQMKVG